MTKKPRNPKLSTPYAEFRKKAMAAAKKKGIDVRSVSKEEFDRMTRDGHVLATKMSAQLEGFITTVQPPRGEGGVTIARLPGGEITSEVVSVVVGVVAGDVAGTISSKKVNK
jgi:hypothetical protein